MGSSGGAKSGSGLGSPHLGKTTSLEFFLGRGRGMRGDRFSAKAGTAILLNFYQFGKCCGGTCRSAHGIASYANVSPGVAFYLL